MSAASSSPLSSDVKGAGFGLSAIGSLLEGAGTANALDYNAEVQGNNAYSALLAAKMNADKQSLQTNRIIGGAKAAYGASGVTADSGSVFSVLSASAANAELDRQNIIYGGQVKAVNYENQAALDKTSAQNALTSSYLKAAGSIAMIAVL